MGHKGHYGEYSGNAKWSRNHADTKVTKSNYKASERDDAAHIDYLKRDVDYDNKHGHSDSSMTNDEKHISKLAGDMKYDKEHHGSPAKKSKAAYVGGTVDYQSGDTTREFGTSGGNRRSVEIKSNVYGDGQATKTVHKLNKKTNEVESRTRNISNKRAARIENRKYKRFQKAGAEGVNNTLTEVGSPAKHAKDPRHKKAFNYGDGKDKERKTKHLKSIDHNVDGSHSTLIRNTPNKMVSPVNKSSRYLSDDDITRKIKKVDKKLDKVNTNNSERKNKRKLKAAGKTLDQINSNTKETVKIKNSKVGAKSYGDNMFTTLVALSNMPQQKSN